MIVAGSKLAEVEFQKETVYAAREGRDWDLTETSSAQQIATRKQSDELRFNTLLEGQLT